MVGNWRIQVFDIYIMSSYIFFGLIAFVSLMMQYHWQAIHESKALWSNDVIANDPTINRPIKLVKKNLRYFPSHTPPEHITI